MRAGAAHVLAQGMPTVPGHPAVHDDLGALDVQLEGEHVAVRVTRLPTRPRTAGTHDQAGPIRSDHPPIPCIGQRPFASGFDRREGEHVRGPVEEFIARLGLAVGAVIEQVEGPVGP